MGGLAQINCMKQFTQFGMQKEMALGGALFELEAIKAVPKDAQAGTWAMEWWWNQPNVPEVVSFVADFRKATGKIPSARHWFGYVAVHSVRLAAEKAKSLEGPKMAMAMEGMELPPDVALQPGKIFYRAGDHELMCNIFVGDVHPPTGGNPDDVFTVTARGAGRESRRPGFRNRLQDGLASQALLMRRRRNVAHASTKGGRCCNSFCSTSRTG